MKQANLFEGGPAAPTSHGLAGCVTEPWQAWFRFQRAAARAVLKARANHRATQPLLIRQREIVHAALRGAS